jgi:hypothetical protein
MHLQRSGGGPPAWSCNLLPQLSCRHRTATDGLRRLLVTRSGGRLFACVRPRVIAACVLFTASVYSASFAAPAAATRSRQEGRSTAPVARSAPKPTPDWYTSTASAPSAAPRPAPDPAPVAHAVVGAPRLTKSHPPSALPAAPQQRVTRPQAHGTRASHAVRGNRLGRRPSKVSVPSVFRLNLAALAASARPVRAERDVHVPRRAALAVVALVVLSAVLLLFTMRAERMMRSAQ